MPNQENERSQNEDLKTLKKEIEDDANDRKTSHAHGPGEPILCKLLCYWKQSEDLVQAPS